MSLRPLLSNNDVEMHGLQRFLALFVLYGFFNQYVQHDATLKCLKTSDHENQGSLLAVSSSRQ